MSTYEEDITREAAIREIRQRGGLKRIKCNICGKPVSTLVPATTVVRAWIECPECVIKKAEYEKELDLQRQSRGPRP